MYERLVGSPAFKAGGTGDPRPAGSIPVHLRHQRCDQANGVPSQWLLPLTFAVPILSACPSQRTKRHEKTAARRDRRCRDRHRGPPLIGNLSRLAQPGQPRRPALSLDACLWRHPDGRSFRSTAGRARRCPCWDDAAWTSPGLQSDGCAHG